MLAEINAAFFAEAGMDELLIVGPAEPARGKAARKGHLQIVTIEGRASRVERQHWLRQACSSSLVTSARDQAIQRLAGKCA